MHALLCLFFHRFIFLSKKKDFCAKNNFFLSLGASICLDMLSIKTLDLDISKTDNLTVEKILKVKKQTSQQLRKSWQFKSQVLTVSITLKIKISQFLLRSRQFKNRHLDCRENLDSLKKDISVCRDISISILIALDCRDPQAYFFCFW